MMEVLRANVRDCCRCGNYHAALKFQLLQSKYERSDGKAFTHVTACPETGESLFLRIQDL